MIFLSSQIIRRSFLQHFCGVILVRNLIAMEFSLSHCRFSKKTTDVGDAIDEFLGAILDEPGRSENFSAVKSLFDLLEDYGVVFKGSRNLMR